MKNWEIALAALGGSNRLAAMIAAHNMSYTDDDRLAFNFRGSKNSNHVSVKYSKAHDSFTMTFYKMTNMKKSPSILITKILDDVYISDLKRVFQDVTGLYLSI